MAALAFPLAFVVWAVLHSALASLAVQGMARRLLGDGYRYYRLAYVVFSVTSFAALWIFVPKDTTVLYQAHGFARYLLLAVRILGLALFVAAATQFDAPDFLGWKSRQATGGGILNTDGLFAYVRHPLYLASLLIIWAVGTLTVWWLEFAVLASAYLFIGAVLEERKMVAEFGGAYLDYRERVPMWFGLRRRPGPRTESREP